ncbi:MAG TPA: hypothetical protein VFS93_04925 [Terrimesophilobacter sp.]|nr:hypothetical protein [Terrimesophilobacter sp.]
MSKFPRWFRPAIATASIVAVGAASVIVGSVFAMPAPSAAPTTAEFPVLQPIGYGPTAPEAPSDGVGEDGVTTSPEQGTRTVPVDADGLPLPGSDIESAVGILSESPDPVVDDWDFSPVDGSDDPCSPEDGGEVEGCPEGLHGATFALISPDNLWGMLRANPPVEITNPYEIAHCPAAEVGPNALRYSIVTNAPGTIELRYWAWGEEDHPTTVDLLSSPQQTEDWESGLAEAEAFEGDWTTLQHCGILDGLEKYVRYDYELTIHDTLGREFTSSTTTPFSLPDDRTAPPFRVQPLGRNAILASAPHRDGTEVRFNVQVIDPGDADDCTATDDRLPLVDQSRGATTVDVSAEYLADHGYLPRYTKRTSLGVYVPSGSTVLVCAGVYEPDRPGWLWHEAQYRYSMVVQTPGTPRPTITLDELDLRSGYEHAKTSIVAQWEGTGSHLSCTLLSASSDTPRTCGADPHDVTRGDVWVTTEATLNGDWRTDWSALLPLGSIDCYDGCDTPETAWYSVPVKLQQRPGELCGSGVVGPCPATTIGSARLRVDWTAGIRGTDTWVFSPPRAGAVEHELDPLPQMDWLVTPTFSASSDPRSSFVQFTLEVDRPVSYTAKLLGACSRSGSSGFEVSGETAAGTSVVFAGACPGEAYSVQVALTDEEGNTNVFGGPGGNPWPDSRIIVPGYRYNVVLGQRLGLKESVDQTKVRQFRVKVDGQYIEPNLPADDCIYGNESYLPPSAVLENARLSESVTVEVTVQLAESWGSTAGTRAYCDAGYDSAAPVYQFTQELPLDDLLAGVTIAAPDDAPYVAEVILRLAPPSEP